jgi:protein-disulfide isomerase
VKILHVSTLAALTLLALSACQSKDPETAQDHGKDLRAEIQALQQQLTEQKQLLEGIKADIAGIKKGMQGGRPSEDEPRPVSIDDDYIRGDINARLTFIEFSDFECPFCERFAREALPLIEKDYIRTGKVRMVYRDFPLANFHKDAQKAAEAAQCAGEQGKYWEMHDMIFNNQKAMRVKDLKKHARVLGLAADRFDKCVDSGQYAEEVKKDLMDGQAAGVEGTPTFFLGYTGQDKTIQAYPIGGARPYEVFKQAFDKLFEEKK